MSNQTIFEGRHARKIDEKFRIQLSQSFGKIDKNLTLIEEPNYPHIIVAPTDVVKQKFPNINHAFMQAVELDSHNRILIPDFMQQHLELETQQKDVLVIGQGEFLRIMTPQTWEKLRPDYETKDRNLLNEGGWDTLSR